MLKRPSTDHKVGCKERKQNRKEMDKRFVQVLVWELVPRMQADAWLRVRFRIRTSRDSVVHARTVTGAWRLAHPKNYLLLFVGQENARLSGPSCMSEYVLRS